MHTTGCGPANGSLSSDESIVTPTICWTNCALNASHSGCAGSPVLTGAAPTYCAMGIYQLNADNSLTLLGACANDTTLFSTTYSLNSRSLTTPVNTVMGQRYAFGFLIVSTASMPTMFGAGGTICDTASSPLIAAAVTGISSLPASVTSSGYSSTSWAYYGAVTP